MKRFYMIIGLILMTFALSSCNLISREDLERTKEEICLENPDNEICQIDEFTTIQEHIDNGLEMFINDFENEMINDDDFCALWFEGIDEDCDGVIDARGSYKDGELEKSVNIDEISAVEDGMVEAKIEFLYDGHVTVLKIALTVTIIDDVAVFKIIEDTILLRGIEKADIRRSIDLFIDDYSDEDKTDNEVCAKWYDGEDNDCDGLLKARSRFKAGAALAKTVNIIAQNEDGFGHDLAMIEFELDGHVTVLKIAFELTEADDVLKVLIIEEDVVVRGFNEEDIKEQVMMFISDLENPNVTSPQLCSLWYNIDPDSTANDVDNDCDDTTDTVRKFKAGADLAKKVNIIQPDDDDDMIYALIEYDFNGHVTVLKMSFTLTQGETNEPVKLVIKDTEITGDYKTFIETEMVSMYRMYIDDYFDTTISFDELNNLYFDNKMDEEYDRLRQLDIENELVVNVLDDSVPIKDDLGYYTLSLEIVTSKGNLYEEVSIKPIRLELSRIDINPTPVVSDYYSISEVEEYFRTFLVDYLDPDSDGDTISDSYFGGTISPAFLTQRDMFFDDGTTVTMVGISARSNFNVDSFFDISYEVRTGDDVKPKKVKIRVNRIDMALVLDDDDDGDSVPNYVLRLLLDGFVTSYNDPLVENAIACSVILDESDEVTCANTRNNEMMNNFIITNYELFGDPDFGFDDTFLFGDPDFLYSVNFIFGDPDFDAFKSFEIEVVLNEQGTNELRLSETDGSSVSPILISTQLGYLSTLLNDPTNTVDTICPTIFDDNSYNSCMTIVNVILDGGYGVTVNEMININDSYRLELVLENAIGEMEVIIVNVSFYMDTEIVSLSLHIVDDVIQ